MTNGEQRTQIEILGRFVWKLLVVVLLTLAAFWVAGELVGLVLDRPDTGVDVG